MSKYIHPASLEAALAVASNLRPDDYREITEGHGHDPENALVVGINNCDSVYFKVPDGQLAGMAGVSPDGKISIHMIRQRNPATTLENKPNGIFLYHLKKEL